MPAGVLGGCFLRARVVAGRAGARAQRVFGLWPLLPARGGARFSSLVWSWARGLPAAAAASGVLAAALLGVCGAARPARPGCPPPAGRRLLCTNASQAVPLSGREVLTDGKGSLVRGRWDDAVGAETAVSPKNQSTIGATSSNLRNVCLPREWKGFVSNTHPLSTR